MEFLKSQFITIIMRLFNSSVNRVSLEIYVTKIFFISVKILKN